MKNSSPLRIGVIGTAGRGDDATRLNADVFRRMLDCLRANVDNRVSVSLVSGGAAWADHLAVAALNKGWVQGLSLHLPASFSLCARRFVEPYVKCPGSISNAYHRKFSRKMGASSLDSLARALESPGCVLRTHYSFETRNAGVAEEAAELIAFTFGVGPQLKKGGTLQTVAMALAAGKPVTHVDLNTFQVFDPEAVRSANA